MSHATPGQPMSLRDALIASLDMQLHPDWTAEELADYLIAVDPEPSFIGYAHLADVHGRPLLAQHELAAIWRRRHGSA